MLGFSASDASILNNMLVIQNSTVVKTMDIEVISVVTMMQHSLHGIRSHGL